MSHLKSLDIGFNDLAAFPEWLANLTNLQKLYTRKNNLTTLPKWLLKLTKIQSLDLSVNHLKTLPEWLDQLPNLKKLDLSSNKLETLPKPLTQLSNLESLRLSENNLRTLPASLVNLPKLVDLRIANNPIVEPSPEVLGAAITNYRAVDLEALRRYYAQLREEGEEIFYEAKLLIIGEGGAGKTSLARKLREPDIPLDLKEESTKGIEVVEWGFELPEGYEQEKYRVNIWDFGGQEIYFATHQFFLTKRSVYVLVADTRRQHTDFYNWLRMQETFGAESAIVLLKNRNREHGSRFSIENLPELQKRFPNLQEVIELDLSNVPQEEEWPWLLQRLKSHFLKLEHVGQPRPSTWVRVRQALNEDERDTVSREEFLALCYEQGVKREADALQLSDYLHHLGDILHFQDDPVLGDIVILKPTWGLDAVYRVLDNVTIVDNWGRFTLHDLRRLWHKDHYNGHHHQLLRLMQNFQLCYPLYDMPDTFIAPQLLREDVPEYEWDGENNLQLRYHYPVFMPRGILSRAIVKLNNHIEEQRLVWRSGVILKDKYARAEVLELRVNYEIRIRISGRNKGNLMMEIVRALDELHQGFPKLQYHKLIPCNCLTCRPLADPNFFPLELLLDAKARGERNIQCYKSFKQVNIRSLLDEGYQSLARLQEREGMVQYFYGDIVGGDKVGGDKAGGSVLKDIGISDVSGSAFSIGDEGSASARNS